jgi:hypothetical protein
MNINSLIENIQTREDFVAFVYELIKDYRENPEAWENNDIESFLEAMAAVVEDMDGYYINQGLPVPDVPDWKTMAEILMTATLYE